MELIIVAIIVVVGFTAWRLTRKSQAVEAVVEEAPYKVDTPVAPEPVVETVVEAVATPVEVVAVVKKTAKKAAAKKAPAKTKAATKPATKARKPKASK